MDLGEYLSKSFNVMFKGRIYLAAFVTSLILWVIMVIIGVAVFASMGAAALTSLLAGDVSALATLLMQSIAGLSIGLIIYTYFNSVFSVFVAKKIKAYENSKEEGFFEHFGECFGLGLKLFFAQIIYLVAVCVVSLIVFLIALIPVVGIILAIILGIFLFLYVPLGMLAIVGEFANRGEFGTALGKGFTIQFKRPVLLLYWVVFAIVFVLMAVVLGLIGLIPVLGQLAAIFIGPLLTIYLLAIGVHLASE